MSEVNGLFNGELSPEAMKMVDLVSKAKQEIIENHERNIKVETQNCLDNLFIYHALKNAGISGIPENLSTYELKYGFKVLVENPIDFRIIKRLFGNLEVSEKNPLGDGRSNKIEIAMTIVKYPKLKWYTKFVYIRKLSKKDKCKVVTQTRRRQVVVCNA